MLKRIVEGNSIKQGSAITYTTVGGSSEILDASQANNAIENSGIFVGNRGKVYRFYTGDSNGLQTTTTYTIAAGADDGQADRNSSSSSNSSYNAGFSNSNAKEYIGVQDDEGNTDYFAGYFRFNNIVAEQGATVQSAFFKFNKVGFSGNSVDYNFYVAAYDDDNKTAPSAASHLNHSNYTTAEVAWGSNTDTGNGTIRSASNGTVLSSPDIKTVIQEVLDRSGWSSGNSIVIAFYPKTSQAGGNNQMVRVEMYEDSGDAPAQLEITT